MNILKVITSNIILIMERRIFLQLLLAMNILAFLFHTVTDFLNKNYAKARGKDSPVLTIDDLEKVYKPTK